jgi:HPt (histidine-containing phosphotransfer) domain-containing protein
VPTEVVETGKGAVIDVQEMRRRFGGDDELVREIAREVLTALPSLRAELGEAAAKGDLVELVRVTHRLRGTLLEVAALSAAELAHCIEHAPGSAAESMSPLSTLLDSISTALNELDQRR